MMEKAIQVLEYRGQDIRFFMPSRLRERDDRMEFYDAWKRRWIPLIDGSVLYLYKSQDLYLFGPNDLLKRVDPEDLPISEQRFLNIQFSN